MSASRIKHDGSGSAYKGSNANRQSQLGILGLWDALVDPKVGIIQEVRSLPIENDDPNLFHYFSKSCDTSRFSALKNFSHNGGVSTDRRGAIAKAMGEAIERYCSAIFTYRDLKFASFNELSERATEPGRFALFSEEQYSHSETTWRRFDDSTSIAWTNGNSLLSGEKVHVPACMVFAPYQYVKNRPDTPICQSISTGLACGSTYEDACISAICEVIERDAFTLMWQSRMSCPAVTLDSLPASSKDLIARFERVNLEVKVVDITTDIPIPTIMTIALGASENSPALAFAAASDPCPQTAVRKSLEELAHTRKYAKQVMQYMAPVACDVERGHPDVIDQRTHLRFYCPQSAREYAQFAWSGNRTKKFGSIEGIIRPTRKGVLEGITDFLRSMAFEPIICDLTTTDVRELGLFVVRAIIPGLHPLYMGYRNRAKGGTRITKIPAKFGYGGSAIDNPYPHPFP